MAAETGKGGRRMKKDGWFAALQNLTWLTQLEQTVEKALQDAQLQRIDESKSFELCILKTAQLPTVVLWQNGPLLWVHPNASPAKIIEWYPNAVAQLALRGIKAAITYFG